MVKPFVIKVDQTEEGLHIDLEVKHENGSSRRSQTLKTVKGGKPSAKAIGSRILWMLDDAEEEGLL